MTTTTKKKLTVSDVAEIESKLVPFLRNEPSEPMEIFGGYKVSFKRPSLPEKSKAQLWKDRKFAEIGLEGDERYDLENPVTFYWTFFGVLNSNVVAVFNPDGSTAVTFDPKVDTDFKFLFEKFIDYLYNELGVETEEPYISSAMAVMMEWQGATEPDAEDVKK